MEKFGIKFIHFLGNLLIGLARAITILRSTFFIMLAMAIIMGVLMLTMIGAFDLITPGINTLGKTYWDIIAVVLGGATMWFGFTKVFEGEKQQEIIK